MNAMNKRKALKINFKYLSIKIFCKIVGFYSFFAELALVSHGAVLTVPALQRHGVTGR